jgi:hypothetical protein
LKKKFPGFFRIFLFRALPSVELSANDSLSRAVYRALGKAFADQIFAEDALPRAAFGKGFAEGLRGFTERLGPSAKQPAPVVTAVDGWKRDAGRSTVAAAQDEPAGIR